MFTITTFVEGKPVKLTSWLTLLMFSWVFYISPNAYAVNEKLKEDDKRQAAIEQALDANPEQAFVRRLQKVKDLLTVEIPRVKAKAEQSRQQESVGKMQAWLSQYGLFRLPVLTEEQRESIRDLQQEIQSLRQASDQGYNEVAEHIRSHRLPAVALERHLEVTRADQLRFDEFNQKIDQLLQSKDYEAEDKALKALTVYIEQQQFSKTHNMTNLEHLPFGIPDNKVRAAHEDSLTMQRYLGIKPVLLASLTTTGLLENTKTPAPADLAENIEIQLTDAIKAKAAELNHNPVEIYTWVHNNVQYIPSYGSIQGADYTLQSLKGNSFDTASLLIALLRASGIPARYAYGTIDMPIERLKNWVGGVDNVWAATNLIGQGGIPHTLIKMNGVFQSVRMEHVWVEAFVDFEPSRGVNNVEGDNWIPMDASYKQYDYTPGMDIQTNVPFNADALVQSIQANTTFNEGEGWIQNLPQADIEQQLTAFQTQVQTYIENQNPDATLGEVLGLRQMKVKEAQPLAAGLPYQLITAKQTFSEMPSNLRHTFSYSLAQNTTSAALGTYLINVKKSLPELAGKKLALSYKPATADDEAIILSYIPDVPEGQTLDASQLPSSLPGYLINMVAEFTIDGTVVASKNVGKMGTEIRDSFQLTSPTGSQFPATGNNVTVGQYHAIGLDLQSLSASQLQRLQTDLTTTQAQLEAAQTDTTALDGLTKHAVVGDLLQATVQSYFAMNDIQDQLLAQAGKAQIYRMPSYGKFSTNLDTIYSWGIPKTVKFSGMMMDMDFMIAIITPNSNDADQQKSLVQQVGMINSTMEHLIPEQIFSTPENPAYGVSAVKAIQLAAAQGQKIYRITLDNLDTALAAINLNTSTEQEIRDAVYAGKEVTTHTHKLNYQGMIVAGYIILDPINGTGAYKIASGEDGAWQLIVAFLNFTTSMIGLSVDTAALILVLKKVHIDQAGKTVLEGLTKVLLVASLSLQIYDIANNLNCSASEAIYLTIFQSFLTLLLFYIAGIFGALLLNPVFIFVTINLMSKAIEFAMKSATNATCGR